MHILNYCENTKRVLQIVYFIGIIQKMIEEDNKMALKFTKENFEEMVINSDKPVIVDFWAPWCGPCKMMTPEIDKLSTELEGTVVVGKVNIDEQEELAKKYGVMSIPTVALFKNGKIESTSLGFVPKNKLLNALGI